MGRLVDQCVQVGMFHAQGDQVAFRGLKIGLHKVCRCDVGSRVLA